MGDALIDHFFRQLFFIIYLRTLQFLNHRVCLIEHHSHFLKPLHWGMYCRELDRYATHLSSRYSTLRTEGRRRETRGERVGRITGWLAARFSIR